MLAHSQGSCRGLKFGFANFGKSVETGVCGFTVRHCQDFDRNISSGLKRDQAASPQGLIVRVRRNH